MCSRPAAMKAMRKEPREKRGFRKGEEKTFWVGSVLE
jgi:hypothetical protein